MHTRNTYIHPWGTAALTSATVQPHATCYISTDTAQLVMSLDYITALSTLQPTDLAHSAGEGEGS